MKKLMTTALFVIAFSANATLFPRLFVMGSSAQLNITNNSDKEYTCSGSIWLYRRSGRMQNEYYFNVIRPYGSDFRYFTNYSPSDQFTHGNHSIFCR
jgi:hypothetical protein